MATCQTKQCTSSAPYVQLTVSLKSSTPTQSTFSYSLKYIASDAARTTVPKAYIVTIGGTQVATGTVNINGKTGTHTLCESTVTISKTKAAQTITCSCSFVFNLSWSGHYVGTETASTTVSVHAISKYTVTYNANGGTGAPAAQSKWYGEALTLSSTKPTRTGYTFQGWSTELDNVVEYNPGASYTANETIPLYAVWKANTYTVTYNANGGTGAPAAQTKEYGKSLTLTTSISNLKRTNYTFKGWAISATGAVSYQPGWVYTNNNAITLYAVWESSYVPPQIYNVRVEWDSNSQMGNDGITRQRPIVSFDWKTTNSNPSFTFDFYSADELKLFSKTLRISSGATHNDNGPVFMPNDDILLNPDESYTVKINGTDGDGSTIVTAILTGNIYPIDVLAEGKGISFGGPASLKDTAHFQWAARFDKSVCGNVPGMHRLPEIPANDDFNNYMTTGCWAVYKNANAETIANIPVARAGRLEVWSATGEGIRAEQWSYLRQRFIPYNIENATWERDIARGEDNIWRYYDWHRTTLTPEASEKIYSKSAITVGLKSNVTLGVANSYTKIPLNECAGSMGDKLTIQNNAVRIGAGITRVKVSGQTLVKCGSVTGNRHARIQTISDTGVVINNAWVCLYATANSNTVFALTPVIAGVKEGWTVQMVYYTSDTADANQSGSFANGYQTYLTVEEL